MEIFKKLRGTIKGKITRSETYLNSCQENPHINYSSIVTRLESLDQAWMEYEDIHSKIIEVLAEDQAGPEELDFVETERKFLDTKSGLRSLLPQRNCIDSNPSSSSTNGSLSASENGWASTYNRDVKLPRMDLPTFAGNQLEWQSFQDLFKSIVHNNSKISSAQKLHYLKNSLRDEAKGILHSLDVTDGNYEIAWKILEERYENKRQIILCHLRGLIGQHGLQVESPTLLRKLLDNISKHVRALTALKIATDQWDPIVFVFLLDKIDPESRKQWELHCPGKEFPTLESLKSFLEQRCRALEASHFKLQKQPSQPCKGQVDSHRNSISSTKTHHAQTKSASMNRVCPMCGSTHYIQYCPELVKLNTQERNDVIKKSRLCFNCLRGEHSVKECKSKSHCQKCEKRHHTLLHRDSFPVVEVETSTSSLTTKAFISRTPSEHQVLLSTAVVKIQDNIGSFQSVRVLLDSGSQATLLSESCAQRLGMKRSRSGVHITGIGESESGKNRGEMKLKMQSSVSTFSIEVTALIIANLTGLLPNSRFKNDNWEYLEGCQLADPAFNQPGDIDMIVGAEYYEQIILNNSIPGPDGKIIARQTKFGWIISGRVESTQVGIVRVHTITVDLSSQLQKFWQIEEEQPQQHLTTEEIDCETLFKSTHSRDETGRYCTPLPFKMSGRSLGHSKQICMKRFLYTEKRLEKNADYKKMYHEFMSQYLDLGHMERIPIEECMENPSITNYVPHHFVLKDETTTAKFRVVFDGSMKTSNGRCLNETLLVGPTVQDDLHTIISRFRLFKFVFTADITKMYRQIKVPRADADFQRILWRWDNSKPIEEFRLTTVTYGTSAAPYLATRVLNQLADDDGTKFPLAKNIIQQQFYVDDVMAGTNDLNSAVEAQQQLIEICKGGGFELRKWSANHQSLLTNIPLENRETSLELALDSECSVKTLGLHWNPTADVFFFKIKIPENREPISKRRILSEIAHLFDPLGWIAPVVILSKIILQDLWLLGIGWDETVPCELQVRWQELKQQSKFLERIKITRMISGSNHEEARSDEISHQTQEDIRVLHQLHGFSDASEKAYSAVIYLQGENEDGMVSVQLVTAKTRVAPVKQVSLPRLELCGAVLLSKLMVKVTKALNIPLQSSYAWTDSMITLDWLSQCPRKWTTFVANRVGEVQSRINPASWRHVPSKDNPADCASRGIMPENLINHKLWWSGPPWLKLPEEHWPYTPPRCISSNIPEDRKIKAMVSQSQQIPELDLSVRYSSLPKLTRVTAYCLRFIRNAKIPSSERVKSSLTTEELQQALQIWIIKSQQKNFPDLSAALKYGLKIPHKHASLNPFADSKGVIRVGGRLRNSKLTSHSKHPILIPSDQNLTKLVVLNEHIRHLHAGPQLTLAGIQQRFWIPNARRLIRSLIHKCTKCSRAKGETLQQQMADLPSYRVQQCRPFLKTGVDFAGPYRLKTIKGRGGKIYKAYIAFFVCMSTKAAHIDLVSDLTSDAFMASIRRFISRRGKPSDMYSDNGTNFVGANAKIKRMLLQLVKSQDIRDALSNEGISWHFIPPQAPHFGGLWEAGIKSTKSHLRRVVGDQTLTFEELTTLLTQIEACLNSRPLCVMSTDPSDDSALTPGHFLIGQPLTALADPDLGHLKLNRLSRWKLVQRMVQDYWKRWHLEYLVQLQQRHKWTLMTNNPKIGDLVLIKEDGTPPQKWPMGRIELLHPGKDNLVRTVTLKTKDGSKKRPISKLCLVPINEDV